MTNVHKSADASSSKVGQTSVAANYYQNGQILSNGYEVALACGELKKARYINQAIEKELSEFKEEIHDKFEKSTMNKTYVFPRRENASQSPWRKVKNR